MYICICKGVTDSAIREAVNNGAVRMRDLKSCLGVAVQCGTCASHTKEVLDQARMHKTLPALSNSSGQNPHTEMK